MTHDPKARIQRQRASRPRRVDRATNVCQACNGKGAVRSVFPLRKDQPCYWFAQGARTCAKCDGTGENDGKAATAASVGDAVRAIGAGDATDWPQEDAE